MMKYVLVVLLLATFNMSSATVDVQQFETEKQGKRYQALIEELRCLVCQNQNLADSNAELAQDLRSKVSNMVRDGYSDEKIMDYLVERYGDFVRYRPPFNGMTLLLWLGPILFLFLGGGIFWRVLSRQRETQKEGDG